jgi:hypothetical protein
MRSMKRIRCGRFCLMTELVRVPSRKKRTPRITVPSLVAMPATAVFSTTPMVQ